MTIIYPDILSRRCDSETWNWEDRDSILYSICLGLGDDPMDERALCYVNERAGLAVVPTLPTTLAWIAKPSFEDLGVNPVTALHGEQKIELHRPIPLSADVRISGRVVAVYDKGIGRGAVVVSEHSLFDTRDDSLIAVLTTTCFGRSEGGCGGSEMPAPIPHAVPDRPPDRSVDFPTRADLALLYRLTGDRNPIHADPGVARQAGFSRPILHGLCSFGITCRAVLENFAEFDAARIASHQARFTAPVMPGETLSVDMWLDADVVSFRARVRERNDVVVLSNGKCVLRC